MSGKGDTGILGKSKIKLKQIAEQNKLLEVQVSVEVKALTAEEAIGRPQRKDFPIIEGKERLIEANIL